MKIIITIVIFMLLNSFNALATQPNSKRMLLSYLRGGDYAHAGDTEAIDIILDKIIAINPNIISGNILDIGCGFGGTLEYLKNKGFKNLYGVDINQDAINYAKATYSNIAFDSLDALKIDSLFPKEKFDLVILFNSIYAIEDKTALIQTIDKVSKPRAILVVFDYSTLDQNESLPILDFAGNQMKPIELKSLLVDLEEVDWKLLEAQDLSLKFISWYSNFLENLHQQRNNLKQKFLNDDINQVNATFAYFLKQLRSGHMGGIVIYAVKK